MATVGNGVNRLDVKFLNRFSRVSFDFCEPRNAKRSETIAKRSKTPLKKSNSMMVLRTIDAATAAVSAAPSSVDTTSTDDVTSSSCSIETSPIPTDSSSTGNGRRRRLPSLPTQETGQGINGALVSVGGPRKIGLQRKHSFGWPSSSGVVNHRSIDSVNHRQSVDGVNHHRSVDGVNHHQSVDGVNHHGSVDGVNHHRSFDGVVNHRRSIDGVNHRRNEVLGGCSNNGLSLLPSESIDLSGNSAGLYRNNPVNHRPNDFVSHRKSDPGLIKHHPSDTVTRSPTVSSNRHSNGAVSHCPGNDVSVHDESRDVNQSVGDSNNLHDKLDLARRDSDGYYKSELVIHLQDQSDIELQDASDTCLQGQSGIKVKGIGITHIKGQSDIKLKETDFSHLQDARDTYLQGQSGIKVTDSCTIHTNGHSDIKLHDASELKTFNTNDNMPQHLNDNINHFEGSAMNLKTSDDETLRSGLANDCQNEALHKSFLRQGRDPRDSDRTLSSRIGSRNHLISPSREKSVGESQAFSETCQPSIHSPAHKLTTLSSQLHSVTNSEYLRTTLKQHATNNSPIQIAATCTSRKDKPLITSTRNASEDDYRSPGVSEINPTPSEDADLVSLHTSPRPECPTTNNRKVSLVATPSVPTLHTLLQYCQMTAVSLVRSTPTDDCGVKLTSVPFVDDAVAGRHSARLAPVGRRATKLGSPDGAFRPVAVVETSPGVRDVHPQVVVIAGVDDESAAATCGNIREGDIVLEVNGTYVLGSAFDAIESLLTLNQQRIDFVLAKPIGATSPAPVNGWLSKTDGVSGFPFSAVQHPQNELLSSATPDQQQHPILEHVQRNCQTSLENSNSQRLKTIAVRPTALGWSSKWSSESAYTIRPIEADSAINRTIVGFSEPDEAYYPSSDSCDEISDSDYKWQKVSAV